MQQEENKGKNKNPALIQITAEQLLREAKGGILPPKAPPAQRIASKEELEEYQEGKRKEFENAVRRNRAAIGAWLNYAAWEAKQDAFDRSRSVYERALEHDHRTPTIWLKYIEMEMKLKNVNRARNLFDRVVMILPRVDVFWYKYSYMEELLGNYEGARGVFERWMEWQPPRDAWLSYVKFEERYKRVDRARDVFKRFVTCNPESKSWILWAKFEENHGGIPLARQIYEECIESLGPSLVDQNVYISFAKFETRVKEIERARAIYQYALDNLPIGAKENIQHVYTTFEKQYGAVEGLERVVLDKRRLAYETTLAENAFNYDVWFDYIKLEEETGNIDKIRQVYERAVANVPLIQEKKYWRRYVYLWIYYAVFEEVDANDNTRARAVYELMMKIIPHSKFTFGKVWKMYTAFLIRRKDVTMARKIFGRALGVCPKERVFKDYINMELGLREFDRVRKIYEKYLEWKPENCRAWIAFAELESGLGDVARARGVYEIACEREELDMPEVLWKSYLDFEIGLEEWERARSLYARLLERTSHIKVQISFANFEFMALDNGTMEDRVKACRSRFEKINKFCKDNDKSADRVVCLESWLEFEKEHGDKENIENVKTKLPKTVKKRRRITGDDGTLQWEEYYDHVFPEDGDTNSNIKLLEMAHAWKNRVGNESDSSSESDSDDE